MSQLKEWVLENKDELQKIVEFIGQGCEVLAATVGRFHPLLEAVFLGSAEILGNPEGKEAKFLAEQFEKINQKLKGIQDGIDEIALEMKKTTMNKQNFDYESNINNQYETFQKFVNATTDFKEKKKDTFISQYENTGGDLNIDALYNAVTGENLSGDPILDTVVTTEQRSRKPVEEFCARLKKKFVMGIIAVMGYAVLKEGAVDENILKKWQVRMKDVETRMKAAVNDCIENFPVQAKTDVEHQLLEQQASVDPEFARSILKILEKKYYWVSWSVLVFNQSSPSSKKYHRSGGGGDFFEFPQTKNKIKIVVSFSADPKPINKIELQAKIDAQELKGNMQSVAEMLWTTFPNTVVQAISEDKVEEKNNFQPEYFYFMFNKSAYLCIHSK